MTSGILRCTHEGEIHEYDFAVAIERETGRTAVSGKLYTTRTKKKEHTVVTLFQFVDKETAAAVIHGLGTRIKGGYEIRTGPREATTL